MLLRKAVVGGVVIITYIFNAALVAAGLGVGIVTAGCLLDALRGRR